MAGRSTGGTFRRLNVDSIKLTPRISAIPNMAITKPSSAANRRFLIGDGGHLRRDDAEVDMGKTVGDEIAEERSDPDRREARHRIVSDHEFETVGRRPPAARRMRRQCPRRRRNRPSSAGPPAAAGRHGRIRDAMPLASWV